MRWGKYFYQDDPADNWRKRSPAIDPEWLFLTQPDADRLEWFAECADRLRRARIRRERIAERRKSARNDFFFPPPQ